MDKAKPDPVAAANSAVNAAQQTLNTLIEQRDAVTAREQQLSTERGKIAFAAHGDGNTKAKTRLAAIHRELAEIGSELSSYDAAVEEAQSRHAAAQEAARREVERERAKEALDHLETLLQHAHGADAALRQYLTAIVAVDQCAQRVCAIASRPSRDIVCAALKRSLLSALTAHRQTFELPLLPPNERKPLAEWAESWATAVRGTLKQRIAEPERLPEQPEAA